MSAYCTNTASSSEYAWNTWTTGTDSPLASVADYTWETWNESCTYEGTHSSQVWEAWVEEGSRDTTPVISNSNFPPYFNSGSILSQEEIRRIKEEARKEREKARIKRKEIEAKRKKAEKKATDLLLDLIGSEELEIYNKTGRLFVRGEKYDYILKKEGFVKRIEKNKITDLCIHLKNKYTYPETDNVIALKLFLESNEKGFNKMANEHGSRERPEKLPLAACM